MVMEDNESCDSRVEESPTSAQPPQQRQKFEVYSEVLRRLKESNNPESTLPGFDDELWSHFNRLPNRAMDVIEKCELQKCRYALDVNVERAEDVLTHKRLLQLAHDPANRPAFHIRLVQVQPHPDEPSVDTVDPPGPEDDGTQQSSFNFSRKIHPPPAFGTSPTLEALAIDANRPADEHSDTNADSRILRPMHEVTFSTEDKPKVLSQLTALLAEVGLNIQEAHAFSTADGYSLDVFVVDGWPSEEVQKLRSILEKEVIKIEKGPWLDLPSSPIHEQLAGECNDAHVEIPSDGRCVWEIDVKQLNFEKKVASGSYGDLQEVAIKVLKAERINNDMQKEFAQEVYILRKVRHKNVVQFIGASTRAPSLCIVTEFMSGGSVYDYLHKRKGTFKLPSLLKVAIDVSKGMNYLHQNNIIHRDLKAANLLMDENEVVKVCDFGVARVKVQSGVMTSETGTYRWMAPEVIEHKPYGHKADVFSFGIVMWELLTGKIPYEYLTPLQAAVGVVQKNLRPTIPKGTHPMLSSLLERCWQKNPNLRPDFSETIDILQQIAKEVADGGDGKEKHGKFMSVLRRGQH
ncbi:hypothetical protein V2J09_000363 [Rumex salicifolius]